jgi:hypothetical protein
VRRAPTGGEDSLKKLATAVPDSVNGIIDDAIARLGELIADLDSMRC